MTFRCSSLSGISRDKTLSNLWNIKQANSISHRNKFFFLSSCLSSSSHQDEQQRNRKLDYLKTWVGGTSTAGEVTPHVSRHVQGSNSNVTNPLTVGRNAPITITNTTYLLPTLRLERSDTPESLASQLEVIFASVTTRTPNRSLSILLQQRNNNNDINNKASWRAPVVLDLQAFMPDGSPHYQAPCRGTLGKYKRILGQYGLKLVGISNCPKSLEQECVTEEGLPIVWGVLGKRVNHDVKSNGPNHQNFGIENVIQLVLSKQAEDSKRYDDDTFSIEKTQTNLEMSNHQESTQQYSSHQNQTLETDSTPTQTQNVPLKNRPSTTHVQNTELDQMDQDRSFVDQPKQDVIVKPKIRPPPNCKVYHGSIRSGQQISTDEPYQSIIIIGNVNSGGECISDGDIYIFGKLRGRALAGLAKTTNSADADDNNFDESAQDDTNSIQHSSYRIFASNFDPELVCIGDKFTTVDRVQDLGLEKAGDAAMVTIDSDTGNLTFESIAL